MPARGYERFYDTGYLDPIGTQNEATHYVTHTWHGNPLSPGESASIKLVHVSRLPERESFWPDYFVQFEEISFTLITPDLVMPPPSLPQSDGGTPS